MRYHHRPSCRRYHHFPHHLHHPMQQFAGVISGITCLKMVVICRHNDDHHHHLPQRYPYYPRVCHQRHDYPCWYGVNARKGRCCWRFWGMGWVGVGWGGVGRANNLHLHFHTNVMLMCVHTYAMLRYCAFLHFPTYIMLRYSTMDSFALSHIHHAACMPPQQTWHTLRLKKRSGKLLQEGPESTKWHCRCSKTHKFPIFRYPSIENESRVWWRKSNICKLPHSWTLEES